MDRPTSHYCRGGAHCHDTAHLCQVVAKGKDVDRVKVLVKNARFFCRKCARAARYDTNLCKPLKM